jgi:transposase
MDDKNSDEIISRRRAIRLMMKGRRPCEILKLIPRSRVWLYKWQHRYEELGWAGLENYSCRPHRSPQAYKTTTRALVLNLRRRLARSSVGLVGARALRHEILKGRVLRTVPCEATIKHWVKDAGLTTSVPPAPEKSYYPVPHFAPEAVLHLMDWTARYIEGGQKVFAFHTLEAQTRGLTETISPSKTVASVIAHGVEVWQQLGVPDFLQLDNDSAFTGGEKTARRFGAFVRLCLYLGIELIFIPPAEPKRNSLVESVHGLWAASFWDRNHFRSFAQVLRQGRKFPEKLLINSLCQPIEQQADHAELDHGFTIYRQTFVIPTMAAIIEQPGKSPLHRPAPRNHLKALALFARDLQVNFMRLLQVPHPHRQPLGLIAPIDP